MILLGDRPEELKTPEEWCELLGARIIDPDGWRYPTRKDWDEPITREEFDKRMRRCTIDFAGYYPDKLSEEQIAVYRKLLE